MVRVPLAAMVLVVACPGIRAQTVRHVPATYASINAAIQASQPNDIVRVAPGLYPERVMIDKNLTLESTGGPWVTTIDGMGGNCIQYTAFDVWSGHVDGFTITNGLFGIAVGSFAGGTLRNNRIVGNVSGINAYGSYVMIEDNEISGNGVRTPAGSGGGIYAGNVSGASVRIVRNTIRGNHATQDGGGIYGYFVGQGGRIEDNVIIGNTAGRDGGGLLLDPYSWVCDGNIIASNRAGRNGGGIYVPIGFGGRATLWHNTIAFNTASTAGGGIWAGEGGTTFTHSILWGNAAPVGKEFVQSRYGTSAFEYCILDGGALSVTTLTPSQFTTIRIGPGVLTSDPSFGSAANDDYHLTVTSPARAAGNVLRFPTDFEGDPRTSPPDLGADQFAPHLYIVGRANPGRTFFVRVIGKPGDPVFLGVSPGSSRRSPPLTIPGVAGALELADPIVVVPVGRVLGNGVFTWPVTLPANVPVPSPFTVQALMPTTFTNAVDLWLH